MTSETLHREADSILEVLVNGSFSAAFLSIGDDLVKESSISAFADVLDDSGEEPEGVVRTV